MSKQFVFIYLCQTTIYKQKGGWFETHYSKLTTHNWPIPETLPVTH